MVEIESEWTARKQEKMGILTDQMHNLEYFSNFNSLHFANTRGEMAGDSDRPNERGATSMAAQMGVNLVYSEFHGGVEATQEMLETLLRRYDRDQVIRLCCLADFAAQATVGFHEPRFTDLLLNVCFPEGVVLQATQKRPVNPGRFVFIRQAVLLVLKTALAVCKNGLDPFEPEQLLVFSEAFLMANEVQVYRSPTKAEAENSVDVLVNFVGIMEYLQTPLKNQIVRSDLSVEIIEELRQDPKFKQYFDLPERFENDLSISIRTFRNCLLGILTKPLNVKPTAIPMQGANIDLASMLNAITVSPEYFSQTKVSAETVNLAFNAISTSPNELSEECARTRGAVYDFTEIKNRPLIKLNNDYIITDIGFVAEKIETGPFWHVMSTL